MGEYRIVSRSCGFCHTVNPSTERWCRECGHEAHVARLACRCGRPGCLPRVQLAGELVPQPPQEALPALDARVHKAQIHLARTLLQLIARQLPREDQLALALAISDLEDAELAADARASADDQIRTAGADSSAEGEQ